MHCHNFIKKGETVTDSGTTWSTLMDTVAVTYSDLHVSTASSEVVSNKTGPFPVDQLHPHLSETVKIS